MTDAALPINSMIDYYAMLIGTFLYYEILATQ